MRGPGRTTWALAALLAGCSGGDSDEDVLVIELTDALVRKARLILGLLRIGNPAERIMKGAQFSSRCRRLDPDFNIVFDRDEAPFGATPVCAFDGDVIDVSTPVGVLWMPFGV